MPKSVSIKVARRLELGDQVIAEVRNELPYGAGNQDFNVKESGGHSQWRTAMAQKDATRLQGSNKIRNLLRMAGTARTWRAGNCQEQAAVAYTVLRSRCDSQTKVSFCFSQTHSHCFAAIGHPLDDPANEVVIADSWPKNAQALLWEDHFCYEPTATPGFVVFRSKFGGKDDLEQRLGKHFDANVNQEAPYIINFTPARYNHEWCSKTGAWVEYTKVPLQRRGAIRRAR